MQRRRLDAHQGHRAGAVSDQDDGVRAELMDLEGDAGFDADPVALGAIEVEDAVVAADGQGEEDVAAGSANQNVVAAVTGHPVVAIAALDGIIAVAAKNEVAAGLAAQGVAAAAA